MSRKDRERLYHYIRGVGGPEEKPVEPQGNEYNDGPENYGKIVPSVADAEDKTSNTPGWSLPPLAENKEEA